MTIWCRSCFTPAAAVLACLICVSTTQAQWSLSQLNTPVVEDFAGFTAPSTWGTANPAANQLDSDIWAFSSSSSSASTSSTFGLNYINGRGVSPGGVGTSGIYALDTGAGVVGIGSQADDSSFTPGNLTLKLRNDTGFTIDQLRVEWTYLGFNDQAGRTVSQLLISDNDASNSYLAPFGGTFITLDNPEVAPDWLEDPRDVTVNTGIADGDEYYLRWSFDDLTGSAGSGTARDEIGIANLSITPLGTIISDTFEWTSAVSGDYDTPGNWTNTTGASAAPPNAGDTANFNEAGSYSVTFTGDATNDLMNVTDGDVTFLSDSATVRTYHVTSGLGRAEVSGGDLQVGSATNPVFLNVKDSLNIGFTGDGTVAVVGADSRLDAQGPVHSLGFSNTQGTLTISEGATANIGTDGSGGTLDVGVSPFGLSDGVVLVQSGGTLNTGHIDIATNASGATGSVTVTGAGSSISQTLAGADLTVGTATGGVSTLNVQSNSTFNTGTGTTTVNASGTIHVTDGTFNANGAVIIDGGTLNVSTVTTTAFNLAGGMTLTAMNDAQVEFSFFEIRNDTVFDINSGADLNSLGRLSMGTSSLIGRGSLIADGAGTTVTAGGTPGNASFWYDAEVTFRNGATGNVGTVAIGIQSGVGADPATVTDFTIESGAVVTTDVLNIVGRNSTTTAIVDGVGSQLNQTPGSVISVGDSLTPHTGTAVLHIQNGGAVSTGTSTNIVRGNGTINIGIVGDGTLNANGLILLDGGTINIGSGGDFTAGTISPINGGQINFTGGRFSFDTINDSLTQQGGVLAPGSSPGFATIDGDYDQQAGGTLEIEIGGLNAGSQYDRLGVTGFATVLGTLDVSLINGFTPALGQSFGFLTTGGGFNFAPASINLPDISGLGLDWRINPGGATVFLEVVDRLPGDLDGDGFVGIDDLNLVLSNWNQNVPPADPLADPSGDGFVGIDDLNAVLGNWNAGTPPTAGAVPEPGTALLIGMTGLVLSYRRN